MTRLIVGGLAALALVSVASAAPEAASRVRATHHARLLMAKADWDYSGKLDKADSAFASSGRVTWAQALLRAARRVGIGGTDGLDDLEVRRFVLRHCGGDRILDDLEEIYLTRALRREYGDDGPLEPKRQPRIALDVESGVRMLQYRGDREGDGKVGPSDDTNPQNPEKPSAKTFAGGLLRYAQRHRIGERILGERELAMIVRRFTGADERLSPAERARLDRTIRPA